MEHRITVMPSGHQFTALEQESLLESALRCGLNINFSCASGSCGDCRARLIEGELGEEDFHDFHFTPLEKRQGNFLLCTSHAASDLVIEAGEASSPRDIPQQQITTKVAKIEEAGEQLRILQLKTPRTRPLRFLAGQHVMLSRPGVGAIDASIASCPCNGTQLQFHIPYVPDNPFVRQLFAGLRHGSAVELAGPYGEMTLDDASSRPLLLIAQEHHLAPIKSLIEHAINLDLNQPVRLFWLARQGEHYLENHCRSWAEALDDYRYRSLSSSTADGDKVQADRVMKAICAELDVLAGWDIYWAGSESFSRALGRALQRAGADPERLFFPNQRSATSR